MRRLRLLQAGSAPGLSDMYNGPAGSLSQLTVGAPAGLYFVRILAQNNCGISAPSNEQRILVGQGPVACSYALTPTNASLGSAGGSVVVNVLTQAGCQWSAATDQAWLQAMGPLQGVGPGVTTVVATVNTGPTRGGLIGVGTATTQIIQTGTLTSSPTPDVTGGGSGNGGGGACAYSVTPGAQSASAAGGTFAFQITTAANCAWQATINVPWISLASASSGLGPATVTYTVSSNPTTMARPAEINVLGTSVSPSSRNVVTVTQSVGTSATCAYAIAPQVFNVPDDGALLSAQITTTEGCVWFASENQSWLELVGTVNSSSLSGAISFAVAGNTSAQRDGFITVSTPVRDFPVTISQAGIPSSSVNAAFSVVPTPCFVDTTSDNPVLRCTVRWPCLDSGKRNRELQLDPRDHLIFRLSSPGSVRDSSIPGGRRVWVLHPRCDPHR